MKVSEFTEHYLKKLNEKEKSQFTSNAHKAFNAYINFVDSNDPSVKDVFFNLDELFTEYKNRYSVNTVRNYCRYLQLALYLEQVKSEFTSTEFEDVKNRITKLVKEADKLSNDDHKKKKDTKKDKKIETTPVTTIQTEPIDNQLSLDDITINDGISNSDITEKQTDLDVLKTECEQLRQSLNELNHKLILETKIKEIYKEELDRMFTILANIK